MQRFLAGTRGLRLRSHLMIGVFAAALLVVVTPSLVVASVGASPTPAPVNPDSASGCNQSVCIEVTGAGNHVTRWMTTAVLPSKICTFAEYWANGELVYVGNTKCGSKGDEVSSYWSDPGDFSKGTQLCNTWSGITGKPCETIE